MKLMNKTLNDVFKSKTFKCSIYLLKYINDHDEEYFNKFINMFREFTPEEKMQVMCNVRANLIGQGKIKVQQNNSETVEQAKETLVRELGIPYDVFEQLDASEQQRIIEEHRQQRNKQADSDTTRVMVGSLEDEAFVKMKSGKKYLLSDGTIVRAGDTPEEARKRLEDKIDEKVYSKPIAFVKKLARKIKK